MWPRLGVTFTSEDRAGAEAITAVEAGIDTLLNGIIKKSHHACGEMIVH